MDASKRRFRGARVRTSGTARLDLEPLEDRRLLSAVVGRQLFYNQSGTESPLRYDGNDPAINANDDLAIAPDKAAYQPGPSFSVRQLTTNGRVDMNPRVYGPNVVWQGTGGTDLGADYEIFQFDGTTTTQLTTNSLADQTPKISSGGVVWMQGSGATSEIIFNDGVTTTPLTTNALTDANPVITGAKIAWEQGSGNAIEIQSSQGGAAPANLSSNSVVDKSPATDGTSVVWINGSVPNQQVIRNDGVSNLTVATSGLTLDHPAVSGQNVVWEGFAGTTTNDREIYLNDGTATTRLTTNAFPDFNPQISGNKVVWWGGTFNNFQIYLYDGTTVQQLSSGIRNQFPQIDGDNVVWQSYDGVRNQIFFYNGHVVTQITNNLFDNTNPQISGNHIVWQGQSTTEGTSLEIFDALIGGPASTSFANVSSYTRGINGIMVDISGTHGTITADDFVFRVGNNNTPSTWATAPAPASISVRTGAGLLGSDRVEITWPDNAIQKQWLEVTLLANANTGLPQKVGYPDGVGDQFYWGNAVADAGAGDALAYVTSAVDELAARNNPAPLAANIPLTNPWDYNRDGKIDSSDQLASRNNINAVPTALRFLTLASPLLRPDIESTARAPAAEAAVAIALAYPAPASAPLSTRDATVETSSSLVARHALTAIPRSAPETAAGPVRQASPRDSTLDIPTLDPAERPAAASVDEALLDLLAGSTKLR